MDRRILLGLAALAFALGGAAPAVLADRLGGNYRGPDDIYIARSDEAASNPDASGSSGTSTGPSGGSSGGGDSGGDSGSPESGPESGGGGGDSGGSGNPDSGGGGGESGGGGGGESGGGESGGGGGDSGSPESGGPESGGGGGDSGGSGSGSGGAPAPGSGGGSAPSGPSAPGGSGGSSAKTGKGKAQEDKDRIWPFYIEGNKEDYLAAVLARRATPRISNPKTSTFSLSPQPEPGRERRMVLETDRQEARDLVLGLLKDKDSRVRDAAVLALGKSGYKDAIPLIQNAAEHDSDPAVREDALLALGLSGQKDAALPALLKALNSASSDRRAKRAAYAALGLGLLGEPQGAVEPLRKMYQAAVGRADQVDEAACAAVALGMLGDAGALDVFGQVLAAKSASDQVKCYTLHALGKYGTHPDEKVRGDALKLLVLGAGVNKREIKQSALLGLGSFSETRAIQALVKEGLGDSDNYCKNYAAHSLGRIAGRFGPASQEYRLVAKELAKAAESENKDRWLFQAGNISLASMAYAEREKDLLEAAQGLGKMNLHSASSVVLSLGMLGTDSPAVAKQLKEAFESRASGTNVQAYAGLALGMVRAPGAAEDLTKALKGADSRPHADVARASALALGLVGGGKEVDFLIEILKGNAGGQTAESAKFFLMGATVQGLGLIADGDTVKKLKPLVTANEWHQRAFSCAALGYFLEEKAEHRISPRISAIFRHHNYHVPLPVVKAVQSTL